jgi:hypothetical protein
MLFNLFNNKHLTGCGCALKIFQQREKTQADLMKFEFYVMLCTAAIEQQDTSYNKWQK